MTIDSSANSTYENADRLAKLGLNDEAWEALHEVARLSGIPVWKLGDEIKEEKSPELYALFREHEFNEGRFEQR